MLFAASVGVGAGCAGTVRGTATVSTPDMVEVDGVTGVQVVEDTDEPTFYTDNYYWRMEGDVWYRSNDYRGGWVRVEAPPERVRAIPQPRAYAHYHVARTERRDRYVPNNNGNYETSQQRAHDEHQRQEAIDQQRQRENSEAEQRAQAEHKRQEAIDQERQRENNEAVQRTQADHKRQEAIDQERQRENNEAVQQRRAQQQADEQRREQEQNRKAPPPPPKKQPHNDHDDHDHDRH